MQTEQPKQELQEDKPKPPRRSPWWRYFGLFCTVWVILVVAAWFRVHPPFYLEPITEDSDKLAATIAGAVGRTFANLLLLAAIALGSGAFGLRLLGWLRFEAKGLERAMFGFGVGLGGSIFLVLGIGLLGGLNWPVMYGLLLALLLLNYKQSWWLISGFGKLARNIGGWFTTARWWERLLTLYLGFTLLIPFIIGLGPTSAWDGLMYHLAAPKLWVQAGRIQNIFEMPPASYPFGIETLYTWALILSDDGLAQTIHWLFMPLGGAAIWLVATRYFTLLEPHPRQRAALFAVTLYFSVPHVQLLASWPYTDLLIAFYAILGVSAMLRAVDGQNSSLYVGLAGVCGGLAFSGKYTAVVVAAAILASGFYYAQVNYKLSWSRFWGWSLLFGGVAFVVAAPWLVRNWFLTGNPVAPIFWGVNGWHPDEIAPIVGKGAGQALSLEMVLGRPFKAAIFGTAGGAMDATISPLYLAFLPLAAWAAWKQRSVATLMFCVGLQYVCWIAIIVSTAQLDHTRIVLPTFPFLALACGYGLAALPDLRVGMLKNFASLVMALFILGNTLSLGLWFASNDTIPYLTGLESKQVYAENVLGPLYRAARFVNEKLPDNSYTFFLFEPRSYYFDRHVAPDLNGGELFYFLDNQPTADLTRAELKRRGVTHLLLWDSGLKFIQDNANYAKPERAQAATRLVNDLKAKYLKQIYEEKGQYSIYELS